MAHADRLPPVLAASLIRSSNRTTTATELAACADAVTASLSSTSLPAGREVRLIAVGGTAEYMAQLIGSGPTIHVADIQAALITCQEFSCNLWRRYSESS